MVEKWNIQWSDKYLSGNEEIDIYHKFIINGVLELYNMLDNTALYRDKILELTNKIEDAMIKHMDIEVDYLKRFDFSEWVSHEKSHKVYKEKFEDYRKYVMPPAVHGILIGELAREYMETHFFNFDVRDMPKINEKLKELQNGQQF